MSESKKIVIVVTNGFDNERSSVAWSIANGAVGMDMEVTMFLVSSGVDWVRKGAAAHARLNPYDPTVGDMVNNVVESGANIFVCPPCAKMRGYESSDFFEGVEIAGSAAMLGVVSEGASTFSF
jgi:predicted peroxiredoxin